MALPGGRRLLALLAGSFAFVVSLAAAELALRVAGVEPQAWPAAQARLLGAFGFSGIEVDPLFGPLPRAGWEGRWFGGFEVEIDSRGFRGTGFPAPDAPRRRVAFLGDSNTFGWGVDTHETFIARLDAMQRRGGDPEIEPINGAYPGDSAVSGFFKLRDRILPLEPDVVVLGFSANNAFRFALASDAERFRFYALRKTLLRSRLFHVLAARFVNARSRSATHPRNRKALLEVPFEALRRVACPEEFERALRRSVGEARRTGAEPIFLLFPRGVQLTDRYDHEDVVRLRRAMRSALPADAAGRELALAELSCLDPATGDVPSVLRADPDDWKPVRPERAEVRLALQRGAAAQLRGDAALAEDAFSEALRQNPDSPLAWYDRGVTRLAGGDAGGLEDLERADRLACSVFLHHQVVLWRLASELDVPVVDLLLLFQAWDGDELFLDPAHPTPLGHQRIAEALWPVLQAALGTGRR